MNRQYTNGGVRAVVVAAVAILGGSLVPPATDVAQRGEYSHPSVHGATGVARASAMPARQQVGVCNFQPQQTALQTLKRNHGAHSGPANNTYNPSANDLIVAVMQQDRQGLAQMVETLASTHSLPGAMRIVALKAPDLHSQLDTYCIARGFFTRSRGPARVAGNRLSHELMLDSLPDSLVGPPDIDNYRDHFAFLLDGLERAIRAAEENKVYAKKVPAVKPRSIKKAKSLIRKVFAGKAVVLFGGSAELK